MAETVTMPKLGFDMAEGTLVRWVVGVGDQVAKGQVLAEIETDKATVEVEWPTRGSCASTWLMRGAVVPIGTPIAVIGGADEKSRRPPRKRCWTRPRWIWLPGPSRTKRWPAHRCRRLSRRWRCRLARQKPRRGREPRQPRRKSPPPAPRGGGGDRPAGRAAGLAGSPPPGG